MTRTLPDDGESLLIRTDFSDDARWRACVDAASQPWDLGDGEDHTAAFKVVDDAAFDGLTLEDLAEVIGNPPPYYVFLVDADTIADPELSILAVNTTDFSSGYPTFRVHPSQMAAVENNLALANMDFEDFSSAVGADGVFRGFTPPATTKNLPKAALREAIDRSTLSEEAIAEYRAALEALRRDDVYPTFVPDVRSKHMELRDRRHEYESCSWLVGLDETIDVLGHGGAAIRFSLPASPQPGRLSGYCNVWVDAVSLVPIAVLANGVPAHSTGR